MRVIGLLPVVTAMPVKLEMVARGGIELPTRGFSVPS